MSEKTDKSEETEKKPPSHEAGLCAADCSMVWTKQTPDKAGYYWWMPYPQSRRTIKNVNFTRDQGFAGDFHGKVELLEGSSGWWAGPIPFPVEPPLPSNILSPDDGAGDTSE